MPLFVPGHERRGDLFNLLLKKEVKPYCITNIINFHLCNIIRKAINRVRARCYRRRIPAIKKVVCRKIKGKKSGKKEGKR